jgi:hypothetical protein
LTGTLQNFARKYGYPIDTVSFNFVVCDDKTLEGTGEPPEDGCYIRGLFVEGARWDPKRHLLGESNPKELYSEMPIVWLSPVQNRKAPKTGVYECPVYKTLLRAGRERLALVSAMFGPFLCYFWLWPLKLSGLAIWLNVAPTCHLSSQIIYLICGSTFCVRCKRCVQVHQKHTWLAFVALLEEAGRKRLHRFCK